MRREVLVAILVLIVLLMATTVDGKVVYFVSAIASKLNNSTIVISYQGGRDAEFVNFLTVSLDGTVKCTFSEGGGRAMSAGKSYLVYGPSANGNVMATATFSDGSEQVILDTSLGALTAPPTSNLNRTCAEAPFGVTATIPQPPQQPVFEILIIIAGLFAVACLIWRKKVTNARKGGIAHKPIPASRIKKLFMLGGIGSALGLVAGAIFIWILVLSMTHFIPYEMRWLGQLGLNVSILLMVLGTVLVSLGAIGIWWRYRTPSAIVAAGFGFANPPALVWLTLFTTHYTSFFIPDILWYDITFVTLFVFSEIALAAFPVLLGIALLLKQPEIGHERLTQATGVLLILSIVSIFRFIAAVPLAILFFRLAKQVKTSTPS